jgi:predicted polyphosphate/ATP-dependent NAD kinase
MTKKLGLIVNPIAGMGGRVGLKGTDGDEILEAAIRLGAKPRSNQRTLLALQQLYQELPDLDILTFSGDMGETVAKQAGFSPTIIGSAIDDNTSADDTLAAGKKMVAAGVDFLLFAGGDGTARNIADSVGETIPVIGIPTGVKIHSAVFAQSPLKAGILAARYLKNQVTKTILSEVIDLDESGIRQGKVITRLYAYLKIPLEQKFTQSCKSSSPGSEKDIQNRIAFRVIHEMEPDVLYLIGPGSTTAAVMEHLNQKNTLLGVDLIQNKKVIANDLNESTILFHIKNQKTYLILTPVGGQGYILGRGNQQLSPEVIQKVTKENIILIATLNKLNSIEHHTLLIDTGDTVLDKKISGYRKIITDDISTIIYKITP